MRGGFTIVEMFATATVLGVVFALLVPSIAGLHAAARSQTSAVLAAEEVCNVLERALADHQAGTFDLASVTNRSINESLIAQLGGAEISGELEPVEAPAGQRLTVTLRFGRDLQRSTSLSAWMWEAAE
jgi:type II secretory pathway pseudopilin PulG